MHNNFHTFHIEGIFEVVNRATAQGLGFEFFNVFFQ
jgi:hypothetical protein